MAIDPEKVVKHALTPYLGVCRHCGSKWATWVRCTAYPCSAADARDPNHFVPTDTLHGPPAPRGPTTAQRLIMPVTHAGATEETRILISARDGMLSTFEPYADRACMWELWRRRLLDYVRDDSPPCWATTPAGFDRLNALCPGLGDEMSPQLTSWNEILKP